MTKKFTQTHEWAEYNGETLSIGITDHAQSLLGDVVFIELPKVGQSLHAGEAFGVVESVKAAADIYAPMTGIVAAVNNDVVQNTALLNQSPEDKAWLIQLIPSAPSEWDQLLSLDSYLSLFHQE